MKHFVLLFVVFAGLQQALSAEGRPPNIVLILADDLGVEGLGCYGGLSYRTPRLDEMAREGLRFEHAYAQPLCTNTRIQLMTGLYNHRNWLAFGLLDPRAKTIGHWLRDAGYRTCMAGKWQLQSYDPPDFPGADERRGIGMKVEDAGFDSYSLWHTKHTEDKGSRYADPKIYEDGRFRTDTDGKYGPDIWTAYIDKFMTTNRHQPFFVYYSMALPHWPFDPTPDSPEWKDPKTRKVEDLDLFKDMVEYTDKTVGKVLDSIDRLGLRDETLVLFYSDNGTHLKITSQTTDGPVAGGKGLTTNAGTHVPLIVRWPKRIKPGVNTNLVDSTDFVPTLLEAAKHPMRNPNSIDGISFYPQLLGDNSSVREWTFCHFDPRPGWDKERFRLVRYVRDKRFKLYDDGKLFDIANDRLERKAIMANADTSETRATRRTLQKAFDAVVLTKN